MSAHVIFLECIWWRVGLRTLKLTLPLYGSTVLLLDLGRLFSFLIPYTVGRTPWTYTQNNTNTEWLHTDIHASSGIGTHDPSVRAGEHGSCVRPRGHCDRHTVNYDETFPSRSSVPRVGVNLPDADLSSRSTPYRKLVISKFWIL
jgi:hypothetical protein